jgi:MinD-like ATPase involved in chromosome partitioning or flagellar assembly/tetratricopeptide (TPR) repeat protein
MMPNAERGQAPREGKIVTFYSYKGGTGRTMALANVAWILAANGMRVLIADWDLESPGLHRFFQPFLDTGVEEMPGIVDFIRRYAWAAVDAGFDPEALYTESEESRVAARRAITAIIDEHIGRVKDYTIPLNWQFPDAGVLHFLSSGKQTNGDYQTTLGALDWDNFYDNLHGGQFFDALRDGMKRDYDYVLIDSRTGLSDVADICTVHLPDVVVDCFTLATQGIEGAAVIAKSIQEHADRDITILPVPMRIDHAQTEKVEAGLAFASKLFANLPAGMSEDERQAYWAAVEVPYRPSYAYEETLATVGDRPGSQTGLLPSYERIVSRITSGAITTLPPREEWIRLRTRLLFSRTPASSPFNVVIDFSPEAQLWAEWIAAVLGSAEITVRLTGEAPAGGDDAEVATQTVAVVSEAYLARIQDAAPTELPDVLISVTETRLPEELAKLPVINLVGLPETPAVDKLIDWFKGRRPTDAEAGIAGLRYPGGDRSQVQNLPARNVNFTGRDKDLRDLREELRKRSVAFVLPLTIQGLGGVGKTQVALEYAHRFRADYDIIWWMNCGQAQYVDASLADLGLQLREVFKAAVPEEGGVAEVVQQVLQALGSGLPDKRWLLIYDNAEDIDEIKPLLPTGEGSSGGHVLITSRDERWTTDVRGTSLQVDVFRDEESVSHLRRRMLNIGETEAEEVARVLGNMPLAVAAAGALLASTDMSVSEYLRRLEEQPAPDLPVDHPLHVYPAEVWKAWNLSLDQLQRTSAAASRLLGICSVMAPDISLDLIEADAMAEALRDLDPAISERAMIARLVRQIDLLALIKLDNNNRQVQVHRVVQTVVSDRMTPEEREAARHVVHQIVVDARPDGDVDDQVTWRRYRLIWPHLSPSGAMWSTEESVRQLLIERVRYLRQRDDLERGRRRAKEIERAWQAMLAGTPDPGVPDSALMVTGKPDPKRAESLQRQLYRLQFNLANILRDLAQFQEARAVDEAVLRGQQEHLGAEHLHTLRTRASLAGDMRALGEYEIALRLDLETYEAWRTVYGDEFRWTLTAANNLALSYLLTGDFRRALAADRQTFERMASVLGPTNPRTLLSGASVARDLLEAGRYTEAVARMEIIWGQCRDTLGDNDRQTLNARLLLGVAQRCAGHPDKAEGYIEWARNGLTRGFGRDSTDALASRLSQALNWLAIGRTLEARTGAEDVVAVYEERLGRLHPHSLIGKLNIATMLCIEEDYELAETEARSAADGLEDRLGAAHPYTLAAKMVVASAMASQGSGSLPEAARLEKLVMEEREQVLGADHPDTLRCRVNLMLTQLALGIEGTSGSRQQTRQQAIADLSSLVGSDHPDVTTALAGNRLLCAIDPLPF